MSESNKIVEIFSCFHEGTVAGFNGEHSLLTLQVNCQYLAKKVNRSYNHFFVELVDVAQIELIPLISASQKTAMGVIDLSRIFSSELEIVSAEDADGIAVIACLQLLKESVAVNLLIKATSARVLDQQKNEISIRDLQKWSRSYWEEIEDEEYNKRESDF